MKYKAVIFDLDGTLLYTLGDIALAVNTALHEFDMPSHPEESYKKFVGHGLKETLKRACSGECTDDLLEKAYLRVIEEYSNNPVITTSEGGGASSEDIIATPQTVADTDGDNVTSILMVSPGSARPLILPVPKLLSSLV